MLLFRDQETRSRSLLKAVTWRTLGSLDTFLLSLLVTGSPLAAGTIASAETVTKVVLYYGHERIWGLVPWGARSRVADNRLDAEERVLTRASGPGCLLRDGVTESAARARHLPHP